MIWLLLLGVFGMLPIVVIWCWISWHWTNPDERE